LEPSKLYEEMKYIEGRPAWNNNIEQFLAHHFRRKGLFHKVKMFPYVMYLAGAAHDDSPTWTRGHYEPAVGHYVKYETEFRAASAYATIIRSRVDWESRAWMKFDPAMATFCAVSLPRRVRYACERAYYKILSALRQPGRAGHLMRFCTRMLNRAVHRRAGGPASG
jgi:hypothetical protein